MENAAHANDPACDAVTVDSWAIRVWCNQIYFAPRLETQQQYDAVKRDYHAASALLGIHPAMILQAIVWETIRDAYPMYVRGRTDAIRAAIAATDARLMSDAARNWPHSAALAA